MTKYVLPPVTDVQQTFKPVSSSVKAKAIYMLLQTKNVDDYVFNEISDFIDKSYTKKGCCVLYAISSKFSELCARLKVDIGKREVVITKSGSILFAQSYTVYPMPITE